MRGGGVDRRACVILALAFYLRYPTRMSTDLLQALKSDDPRDLERACRLSFERERESLSRVIPMALSGNRAAAYTYVAVWRKLKDSLLSTLHEVQPDLVLNMQGQLYIADVKRWPAAGSHLVLEAEALEAPFSSWITATDDVGTGACVVMIQKVRELVQDLHPIAVADTAMPHWEQTETQLRAFRRHVSSALSESDPPLERIRNVFDLSLTELGDLFGVSRQAVTQWIEYGIPEERLSKVTTVAAIADLFGYRLRAERIPGIVRREAAAYGGSTALGMIKEDRHDSLLGIARESFRWSVPA